jgi:hypothetical protein
MRFLRFQNAVLALSLLAMAGLVAANLTSAAYGQTIVSGDVTGRVTDVSGAVVVGATVTLTSEADATVRTAKTTAEGTYRFSLLPPGTYSLKVVSAGLTGAAKNIVVSVGKASTVNVTAQLSSVSTEVVVDSSAQPQLQTEDANITTILGSRDIEQLPVPGGDIMTLAFTAPGVNLSTGAGYGGFVAFGLPATDNLFTLNGNDIMDPYLNLNNSGASNLTLGANEIADVAIVNNGYNAQYGRYPGTQINYTTKAGSNQFHGNAQYFWNGRILNANDWINKNTELAGGGPNERSFSNSNQWAGAIGGPIWRDKFFFHYDQEGLRYVLPGGGGTTYIPTAGFMSDVVANVATANPSEKTYYQTIQSLYAGASGASSATNLTVGAFDPVNNPTSDCGQLDGWSPALAATINGIYGEGSVSPQTKVNGNYYGYTYTGYSAKQNSDGSYTFTPTTASAGTSCTRQFYAAVNNLNTEALWSARIDQVIGSKDHASYRIHHDWGVQATGTDAINSAFNANSVQPEWEGQFNESHTFSPTVVNDLILSGLYYSAIFGPPNIKASLAVFPTTLLFGDGYGFANLGGTDYNYPQGRNVQQYQLVDDLSVQWKKHSFKFGVNYRGNKISDFRSGVLTSGETVFNSLVDFAQGITDNGSSVRQRFARVNQVAINAMTFGIYAQDDWAVNDKLKLTLSLRVDHNANFDCLNNCFSRLTSDFTELTHDATVPYNKAINIGLANAFPATDKVVIQPRAGFSYAPQGQTGRLVVRGGAGLFSELAPGTIADRFLTNAPNITDFTYTGPGLVDPTLSSGSAYNFVSASNTALQAGFSGGQTLAEIQAAVKAQGSKFAAPSFNSIVDKLKTPKVLEYNLETQVQVTHSDVLDFNFVGNYSWNSLMLNALENTFSQFNMAGLPTTQPDGRFGIVSDLTNSGHANYNGLTTSVRHTAKYGLTLSANYTYSHALDLVSNGGLELFNYNATYPQTQLAPDSASRLNYGNADYDIRHSGSFQYVWNIPIKPANAFLRTGLAGWTVSGNLFYRGGYPISIVNSTISSRQMGGFGQSTLLASIVSGNDRNCNAKPDATGIDNKVCFKNDTFAVVPKTSVYTYGYGNINRGSFGSPHYFNSDLQLNKETKVLEKATFKIGANFYNVLNHANFAPPANNSASGALGTITSTVTPPSSPYGSFQGSAVSGRVVQVLTSITF